MSTAVEKATTASLQKPFYRLHFGFIQIFVGVVLLTVSVILFPNIAQSAFSLVADSGPTGTIVKVIALAFAAGFYLTVRQIILYYSMTNDLISLEEWYKVKQASFPNNQDDSDSNDPLIIVKPEHRLNQEELDSHPLANKKHSPIGALVHEFNIFSKNNQLKNDYTKDYVEIMMTKNGGMNKLVRYISSILPLLGLLGTILGLVKSISGLSEFGVEQASILNGIQSVIAGMGLSFYSTIAGLILMIILKYLNNAATHMQQALFSDIYKFLRYSV